jgi:GH18 family chitinase
MRGLAKCVLGLALLTSAVGCSGGDDGPRDSVAGNGGSGGKDTSPGTPPSMRTVMYLPIYSGNLSTWTSALDFYNVTHVNLSFAAIDADGNVRFPANGMAGFVDRAHQAQAKVCVAIGGAATTVDFDVLLSDANRSAFVDKLVAYAASDNLDCLDIDLEGDSVNQYYEAFVTELRSKLPPEKQMTAAVAAWFGGRITDKALAAFDFINVMAYDLYFQRNTPMQWSSMEAATAEVDKWVTERGLPPNRVVYGVPFYGMQWPAAGGEPKTVGYGTLLRLDANSVTEDFIQSGSEVIYLNSRATIQAKAKLAKSYGGIMAWELTQDAGGADSLLTAIRQAVP